MDITEYENIVKIGEGTYGKVYKATEIKTGRLVAIKKMIPGKENEGIPSNALREICALNNIKHETIIELIKVENTKNFMYLVFEYMECDLKKYLKIAKFTEKDLKKQIHRILTALYFCHTNGIIHRDIKPQNLLMDENNNIKVGDFGLCRSVAMLYKPMTTDVITLWYRPPELLLGDKTYTFSVDIWATACVIVEMMGHKPIFEGESEIDQVFKIFKLLGTPNEDLWPDVSQLEHFNSLMPEWKKRPLQKVLDCDPLLADLLEKMLVLDPKKRICVKKALKHEYFAGLDDN